MKKSSLFSVLTICAALAVSPVFAQKKKNVLTSAGDKAKLALAQQSYYAGFDNRPEEFVKALNLFREVQNNNPNDGNVAFHIGQCYFYMEQYDDALASFEKAKSIDPKAAKELMLFLGRTYLKKGQIDNAITALTDYQNGLTEKEKRKIKKTKPIDRDYETDGELFLKQAQKAKELMAKPLSVTINGAGNSINCPYDDKRPSISADGKTMIFTSRRPEGKTSSIDKQGDGKYFDDIYMSTWDDAKQAWSDAEIVKGSLNTEGHDAACSISPDGKQLFVYVNNDETARGGDIFVARRSSSGKWGSPSTLGTPVNTSWYEDGACLSADGNTLYFISENPVKGQAQGRADIWMAKRISKSEWAKPVNLGPTINTPYDEGGIFIHPDGKTLYFSSQGHDGMGGYDIFKTVYENGKWSKPVNLGYPINTIDDEKVFILSTNGKTGYLDSNRDGGLGDRDIFVVDMTPANKDSAAAGPALSILKGTIYDGDGKPVEARVMIYDENGAEVGNTNANGEGEYFITLPGNHKYQVKASHDGFKEASELVDLPQAKEGKGTFEMVRHFILYKNK